MGTHTRPGQRSPNGSDTCTPMSAHISASVLCQGCNWFFFATAGHCDTILKNYRQLRKLQISQILSRMTRAGSWSVVREAHIQAFTFFHCADTLKIMVGCPSCTYPFIHFFHRADTRDHGRLHISKHSRKKACADSEDHGIGLSLSLSLSPSLLAVHCEICNLKKNVPRRNFLPLRF